MPITKDTAISIAVVIVICGGVWWAATVQSDISYMKQDMSAVKMDIAYIKKEVTQTVISAR